MYRIYFLEGNKKYYYSESEYTDFYGDSHLFAIEYDTRNQAKESIKNEILKGFAYNLLIEKIPA